MDLLPSDIVSFVWGALAAGALLVVTGLCNAAVSDLYLWIKKKLDRSPPEPRELPQRFSPSVFAKEDCAWEPEIDVPGKEQEGWSFYPHPDTKGRGFRMANHGGKLTREFLMTKPGAKRADAT